MRLGQPTMTPTTHQCIAINKFLINRSVSVFVLLNRITTNEIMCALDAVMYCATTIVTLTISFGCILAGHEWTHVSIGWGKARNEAEKKAKTNRAVPKQAGKRKNLYG